MLEEVQDFRTVKKRESKGLDNINMELVMHSVQK
jgi:hypothetical protein